MGQTGLTVHGEPGPHCGHRLAPCGHTHVADLEVLPHEQVQGGAGVGADGAHAAAAVAEQPQAQVSTLLGLLFKQELRELGGQQRHTWVTQ